MLLLYINILGNKTGPTYFDEFLNVREKILKVEIDILGYRIN